MTFIAICARAGWVEEGPFRLEVVFLGEAVQPLQFASFFLVEVFALGHQQYSMSEVTFQSWPTLRRMRTSVGLAAP